MKPSRPRLMPTMGTFSGASARATPSMVPSPPTTTAKSARRPSDCTSRMLRLISVSTVDTALVSQSAISSRMRSRSPSDCGRPNSAMVLKGAVMRRIEP